MQSVLDIYQEQGLTKRTTVFVTSLSAEGRDANQEQADAAVPMVPWIASGVGIKPGHAIHQPVSILDTGATVMRTLGLQTHTEWESHAVEEIFQAAFAAAPRGSEHAIGRMIQSVKWYMICCLVGWVTRLCCDRPAGCGRSAGCLHAGTCDHHRRHHH